MLRSLITGVICAIRKTSPQAKVRWFSPVLITSFQIAIWFSADPLTTSGTAGRQLGSQTRGTAVKPSVLMFHNL